MDFSQDNLTSVLSRIASHGSAIYPDGSWDQLATFTALRRPDQFDVDAFRHFQKQLFQQTGIEALVVGGAYGCIRLIVRVRRSADLPPEANAIEVSAEFAEGRGDDAARLLAVILSASPELRAAAAAAGIDRVQTRSSSINTRTGDVTPYGNGEEMPPYGIQFTTTVVNGSVGQIGDHNTQQDPTVSGGPEPQLDKDEKPRPSL